eukprot:m.129547 g.129547  ORF g.129547 m.129547 type:complete len:225 (+) comp23647_c0_seq3:618-1292(+)
MDDQDLLLERPCDVIISRPAVMLKLHAESNLYAQIGSVVNLFLSLRVSGWLKEFGTDIDVVLWNFTPKTVSSWLVRFIEMVFSRHPVIYVRELADRKVCFSRVLFALPGIWQEQRGQPGKCSNSLLLRQFSRHTMANLLKVEGAKEQGTQIQPWLPLEGRPRRVTFLTRQCVEDQCQPFGVRKGKREEKKRGKENNWQKRTFFTITVNSLLPSLGCFSMDLKPG